MCALAGLLPGSHLPLWAGLLPCSDPLLWVGLSASSMDLYIIKGGLAVLTCAPWPGRFPPAAVDWFLQSLSQCCTKAPNLLFLCV